MMSIDQHISAMRKAIADRQIELEKLEAAAAAIPYVQREIDHLRRAMEALHAVSSPEEQERDHA